MIEVKECSKAFGAVKAVNKATLDVGVREVDDGWNYKAR